MSDHEPNDSDVEFIDIDVSGSYGWVCCFYDRTCIKRVEMMRFRTIQGSTQSVGHDWSVYFVCKEFRFCEEKTV
ncbi:hypothetical protein Hanom_Chr02g00114031 [Helianthus anomalus]